MSFKFTSRALPAFAVCALAMIPLTMMACNDPKTGATLKLPNPTAQAPTNPPEVVALNAVEPEPCVLAPMTFNKENFPELEMIRQNVITLESRTTKSSQLRETLLAFANESIPAAKDERQKFVNKIMFLSKKAPAAATEHPLHPSITAYVVYLQSYRLAAHPDNDYHAGLELNATDAMKFAENYYLSPPENIAAFGKALIFANDPEKLALTGTKARAFAEKFGKSPSPGTAVISYIRTFEKEIEMHSSIADAQTAADKAACLSN